MKAKVLNFRQGRRTQRTNQLLLSVEDVDSRGAASKLVGRKIVWKTKSGKEIAGKIAGAHGNNGVVRARFSRGVSGEVLGKELELKE
ncbi:MAG: 50S ribosomal protein L35ae [Candidatus Aenigmarchaeota archaeon]|nr:50S ribosomal protein L35ae [Candidatus Aenigmarchaeota archaeon]